MAGRRVHDDARRLVDHEEVLVGVGEREPRAEPVGCLRLSGRLDLDLLPTDEPVALPARLPVHEHGSGREQSLRGGTRSDVGQTRQVAVEPLARGLRLDDEPFQRLEAPGSRSARTSAASRIPTPITMELSARLKAGQ